MKKILIVLLILSFVGCANYVAKDLTETAKAISAQKRSIKPVPVKDPRYTEADSQAVSDEVAAAFANSPTAPAGNQVDENAAMPRPAATGTINKVPDRDANPSILTAGNYSLNGTWPESEVALDWPIESKLTVENGKIKFNQFKVDQTEVTKETMTAKIEENIIQVIMHLPKTIFAKKNQGKIPADHVPAKITLTLPKDYKPEQEAEVVIAVNYFTEDTKPDMFKDIYTEAGYGNLAFLGLGN